MDKSVIEWRVTWTWTDAVGHYPRRETWLPNSFVGAENAVRAHAEDLANWKQRHPASSITIRNVRIEYRLVTYGTWEKASS